MKIAVATPRCGPPLWSFHDSMTRWAMYHGQAHADDPSILMLQLTRFLPVAMARNLIAVQFAESDADYLWFVDSDAVFLPGTLDRLLRWNVPIAGALCMMRLPECCHPSAFESRGDAGSYRAQSPEVYEWIAEHFDATTNGPQILDPAPERCLLETTFTGCHCMLIRRDVVERMDRPYFSGHHGQEDRYFCEQAAALGFKTYVDLSVLVGHATTDRVIGAFDFMSGHRFLSEKQKYEQREAAALEEAL